MAYTRRLSTRATLIARRYQPSFSYILHDDDRRKQSLDELPSQEKNHQFLQQRSFGSSFSNPTGFGSFSGDKRYSRLSFPPSTGSSFCRYMSTTVGGESEKIMSDVAEALTDTAVQAATTQAPVMNEVAIAAADSFLPVAALQHLIDFVHTSTGFNWWSSIMLTTLLIRGATLPFIINQLKATTKLTLMRPRLEAIKEEMQNKGMDPAAVAEGQKRMQSLFKEYGVSPFTPLKGLFIQGPIFISFFLAISNMTEKVPSFKTGGAYWFLDLTTPDTLWVLPVMTALSFWITVECNMQEGMEGNPMAGTMKNVSRALAVVTIPFTHGFPKAIFCYWITSNLFSLLYGLALKAPGVKKFLGVPEIPKQPPSAAPQNPFDMFSAIKKATAAATTAAAQSPSASPVEASKPADRRISSSAVLSQRIRNLEKQVKGRKKSKK